MGKWVVVIVPCPFFQAAFIGMAQIVRKLHFRVRMDRQELDVGPVIKDRLGSIAVVIVHVKNRDLAHALIAQMLGCDCGIVQEAVAP